MGERLLTAKLQILTGAGNRRPSVALGILTGQVADPVSVVSEVDEVEEPTAAFLSHRIRRQYAARTVYLSEHHLHDIDRIIEAWQQAEPGRLTRSAVLRRAIELLRAAIEDGSGFIAAKSLLENH